MLMSNFCRQQLLQNMGADIRLRCHRVLCSLRRLRRQSNHLHCRLRHRRRRYIRRRGYYFSGRLFDLVQTRRHIRKQY
jgi:hypothetical protein